jgi:DNA-binding MarR family transcriptional regulator
VAAPVEEPDPLTELVRHVMAASHGATLGLAGRLALGVNEVLALGTLDLEGSLGPGELARELGVRPASATLLVDRLERTGHVERRRDDPDRRRVAVVPTERAREEVLAALMPLVDEVEALHHALPPDEHAAIERYLERLVAILRAYARPGEPPAA